MAEPLGIPGSGRVSAVPKASPPHTVAMLSGR